MTAPPQDRPLFLEYPGDARLREFEARLESLETRLSPRDFPAWARSLREAVESGTTFEGHLQATRMFFLAMQDALDGVGDQDALPAIFLETALEEAAGFQRWLPCLDAEFQHFAWNLLDLLHCRRLWERSSDLALAEATALVERSPVPAVRTAARLLSVTHSEGLADPRQVEWLLLLERHSSLVDHLALATEVRATLSMQVALHLREATGTMADDLHRLVVLHERLQETLGEEILPRLAGGRSALALRMEGEMLTREVMEVRGSILNQDPFLDAWIQLCLARIECYAGNLVEASRILESLSDKGFCTWDTTIALARLSLFRKYPEDAREALVRLARRLPLYRRPGDPFQGVIHRLWEEAGGERGALGLTEPPAEWLERAERHREEWKTLAEAPDRPPCPALSSFWAERRAWLDLLLADLLDPADLDAALQNTPWERLVRIGVVEAARCGIDRMPDLPGALRSALVRGVQEPVPAREVALGFLAWIRTREAQGEPLEDLVSSFPCLGGSRAFALERLRMLDLSGRPEECLGLLDLYEGLPEAPDRLLLDLWLACRGRTAHPAQRLGLVRRGRRLWARLRGDAGRTCGEALRQEAFVILQDPGEIPSWIEMVQTILDSLPPEAELDRLGRWFLDQGSRRLPLSSREGFRIAGLLAAKNTSQTCLVVRDHLMTEVVDRLDTWMQGRDWSERREVLEGILDWGTGDPEVERRIAAWYRNAIQSETPGTPASREAGEVGEWLAGTFRGESALAVRRTTGQHYLRAIQEARNREEQQEALQRIEALMPRDPSLEALRQSLAAPPTGRPLVLLVLLAGIVLVALALWFLLGK